MTIGLYIKIDVASDLIPVLNASCTNDCPWRGEFYHGTAVKCKLKSIAVTSLAKTRISSALCDVGCVLNLDCTLFASQAAQGSPDTTTANPANLLGGSSYIEYNAFSTTTLYASNSSCYSASVSNNLSTLLVVPVANRSNTDLRLYAGSAFAANVGAFGCVQNAHLVTDLPARAVAISSAANSKTVLPPGARPSTSAPTNPTVLPPSSLGNSTTNHQRSVKIIISVVVCVTSILIVLSCILIWWKRRRLNEKRDRDGNQDLRESDPQPFFQRKPELCAEGGRHEVTAEQLRYELDEDCRRNELAAGQPNGELDEGRLMHEMAGEREKNGFRNRNTVQELRGLESSHELPDDLSRTIVDGELSNSKRA